MAVADIKRLIASGNQDRFKCSFFLDVFTKLVSGLRFIVKSVTIYGN